MKQTDAIVARLERAIIMGELRPRERLLELSISKQLATNRSKVRSAFRALAEKGLIFLTPGRGAVVAEYTPKQVRDMYLVRQILEAAALELAMAHITSEAIATLRELAERFSVGVQSCDFSELTACNDAFHRYLLHMGDNESLSQMIDQLWLRCHLVRHFAWLDREHLKRSAAEHKEILDILERGDIAQLKELYERHTIGGRDAYLQHAELALGGTTTRLIRGHHEEHNMGARSSASRRPSHSERKQS